MSEYLIIDGWNVCWKMPELASLIPDDLEKVRDRFYQILNAHFAGKKVTYRIVFDGQPHIGPQNSRREKKVLFSQSPEKADDLILRFLHKQRNKKSWTVVTSDNRLALQVKDLGAKVIASEKFISHLYKKKTQKAKSSQKSNPDVSRQEIEYWLDKFSNET